MKPTTLESERVVVALHPEARGVKTHARDTRPGSEMTLCHMYPLRESDRLYVVPHQQVTCLWCSRLLEAACN
jgi:hypothetical protein